jgi:aryl-alcohol dehydrogenase-like predicted oxidoreductase
VAGSPETGTRPRLAADATTSAGTCTRIAADRGVPRARIALAWLLRRSTVTAPVVGATRAPHIEDAVAALDVDLTEKEIERLEQPYTPRAISGH